MKNGRNGCMQRACGMTLLELAVTMAIAVICISLGVPTFQYVIEKQRADNAIHELTSYFASARATAMSHHKITTVCPTDGVMPECTSDGDWSRGWMMFTDADGNHQPDDPKDVLRVENDPLHGHLQMWSSAGRPQIRYLRDGRSAGSNITVRVCSDQRLMAEVIVSNTGRTRVSRPSTARACSS